MLTVDMEVSFVVSLFVFEIGFGSIATSSEDAGRQQRYINTTNNNILCSNTLRVDTIACGTGQTTVLGSMYKSMHQSVYFELNVANLTAATISKDIYVLGYLLQPNTNRTTPTTPALLDL